MTAAATVSLLVASLFLAGGAAGAQDTSRISAHLYDYGKDVNHGFLLNVTDLHPEVDILEVSSALQADQVHFTMKVRGTIVADNASWDYTFRVCFGPVDWSKPVTCGALFQPANITVTFSNGSATLREGSGAPVNVTVVSTTGSTLEVSAPLALFANFTDTWVLKGDAEDSLDGFWTDTADLDVTGGLLFADDVTADKSNYTSPTVAITSLVVQGEGSHFRLTVKGTTSGQVQDLLVGLGDRSDLAGITVWEWRGWWSEQNATELDPNATLAKVGATWAAWQFALDFDPTIYSYGLITLTKVEVRAIAPGGAWGHANQTCACGTSSGPIPVAPPAGGAGSQNTTTAAPAKGFLPGLEAAAALTAVGAAAVAARGRRR